MCGITGFIDYSKCTPKEVLDRMVSTLKHRGPDDFGSELYDNTFAQIGFGQTRLSILDLSSAGHQPMHYKHFSIIYNGEIYNFEEIKSELIELGHKFHSTSDTEVILHAFEEWDNKCVEKFIGMFVFVIYDKKDNKLHAFRDRAGVKPFYYYYNGRTFIFASELKALHKHPSFNKEIDERAMRSYFDFGYVPTPYCIFKNAYKLEPGSILTYDLEKDDFVINNYWNSTYFYKLPKLKINYSEAKHQLRTLLKSACSYRMIADVPVGIFLSGGYDSTAVAAILQKESKNRLKTFTIGFDEGNNEAPYARDTAKYLGTEHHEYSCTTREAQDIIPTLAYFYDEPFADSSAIPTILVSQFAKKHVTVALSADAGDEVFAGYQSYPSLKKKLSLLNQVPGSLKDPSRSLFSVVSKLIPDAQPALKHKLDGISKSLSRNELQQSADLFHTSNSLPNFYMDNLFLKDFDKYKTKFEIDVSGFHDEVEIAMAVDYESYLQNDILTKVDRATMSVSLEGREPLVDHRLLEYAGQLPLKFKLNGVTTKRILKDIVHDYIPEEMMNRPKTGFSLPIYSWLRGDLEYLIEDYLNAERLSESGLFDTSFILKQVKLFKTENLHYSPLIWKLLMFQMWYEEWM